MKLLDKILPESKEKRKQSAVLITILLALILIIIGIYGVGKYGIALFLFIPAFIGISSTILYGYKNEITRKEAFSIGHLTIGLLAVGLVLFALEGLICIVMAAPIVIVMTRLGTMIGLYILERWSDNSLASVVILIIIIPLTAWAETNNSPRLENVTTSVIIDAKPEVVWKHVVEFPKLNEPEEFIFMVGIAYPIDATIEGRGAGAVRHCNFNTGSFVEPIVVWDEPQLLKFDVLEQPLPLRELSFWDIDAPHLHDYFVSRQGQFKLTELPGGKTRLEGTTWYYHDIAPAFYWRLWSEWIIHSIHMRVLKHIKNNAECRH